MRSRLDRIGDLDDDPFVVLTAAANRNDVRFTVLVECSAFVAVESEFQSFNCEWTVSATFLESSVLAANYATTAFV